MGCSICNNSGCSCRVDAISLWFTKTFNQNDAPTWDELMYEPPGADGVNKTVYERRYFHPMADHLQIEDWEYNSLPPRKWGRETNKAIKRNWG